ncbi:Villin-4 [Capsicum annuum]|uniref:Villin-4 n=1 Tax=Capsicum annuum TaxID=4072 RepID=A0A2G2YP77_CAPAN|nr:Villin-4 [Capsicum annuum]KAF3667023.1 Villin-4 [Capsicum annuum]PHT71485.1 Villin-4 [Capsicum annuum]
MSTNVKDLEPAFQGAGQKPGTEVWRIENFQPVPVPKSEYGKFYSGDSYIVLQTTSTRGGAYWHDIHFWLGKDTSQDEAGTAAIKTVELDAILGGRAVQHREIQRHESDKFLSYFKPCIIPLEGGVASGFKKPEEEEFETRLYVCNGKRVVRMKQVPFARSSLNHDDVFILDTEDKIYQFNGANSNIQERAKALEVIQLLKEKYHGGVCDVAIIDDGNLHTESDSGSFWVLFGGFAPISKKVASDDDVVPERTTAKLYSIIDGQINSLDGELTKSILENDKCYILDCGSEVFTWVGRHTELEERKSTIKAAEEYLANQNRPKSTRVTRLIQGYETHPFKSNFDSWPSGSTPAPEEGRGKVAAILKQQGAAVKASSKSTSVNEEVPLLLEGGGKIEVWCIDGSAKTLIPKEDIGKFYSGDCYIVLYTYHSHERKEDYYLCWWIGKDSIKEDQEMAAQLASAMCTSHKGRPVLGRVYQGKEPPQFVAIFQPMVVLKGGLSSGYKNHIANNDLNDETYASDVVTLFSISETSGHNNKAVQVDAVATSLNTYGCFLLQSSSSVFIWHGKQSTHEQQQFATKVVEFLKPGVTVKHTKEGTESSAFWIGLGEKQDYTSNKLAPEATREPHLFSCSNHRTNQDGPTQRASALAALNSAFSSSSTAKASSVPKPTGTSQSSQRAAAVAALSNVLTEEMKQSNSRGSSLQSSRSPSASPTGTNRARSTARFREAEERSEHHQESEVVDHAETNEEDSALKPPDEVFSYEQMKAKSENPATGIDTTRREAYLSGEEFESVLGMTKEAFYKMPKWKQDNLKKKVDLF